MHGNGLLAMEENMRGSSEAMVGGAQRCHRGMSACARGLGCRLLCRPRERVIHGLIVGGWEGEKERHRRWLVVHGLEAQMR